MSIINRSFFLAIFKRLLDLGIGIYLILIPIIIITGGFNINFLGISIHANHLYSPIRILVPLILIRLTMTVEIRNILLLLGSVLLCFLVTEIALRIWNPPIATPRMAQIHQASAVFEWELIPGAIGFGRAGTCIRINSSGFRDTEHPLKKQTEIHRIMVIGDSFTFGMGVNLEDTYSKQLERILHHANINCEVINCGVIGYQMWQHFMILKRKVLPYQPDVVILGLFLDDIAKSIPPYKDSGDWNGCNPCEKDASGVMSHFYLWNFLRNSNRLFETKYRYRRVRYLKDIEERKKVFGPADPTNIWSKIMYGKMEKRIYAEFAETLQKFVLTSKSAGSHVLIVMIPDAAQLHEPDRQAVNRFVEQACIRIGVPFIDVTPRFEKESDLKPLYLFPFDAHTSAKGHRLIAQSIAEEIKRLGFLPCVSHGQ